MPLPALALWFLALASIVAAAASLTPSTASAHRGGLAADGCHNNRKDGTCHCHRAGAKRPGCNGGGRMRYPPPASRPAAPDVHRSRKGRQPREAAPPALPPAASGAAVTAPVKPAAPAGGIRIASWNLNLLHWRTGGALWRGAVARSDDDYRTLARYARKLDADIIAFQEVNGARAAARVFPRREYSLHLSGRHDPRYNDIHNGFAVRKGRFDRVVTRNHASLGLASNPRYQLRWGVDLTVRKGGRVLRLLNVHLKSRCFTKSLTNPQGRHCEKLARQIKPLEAWIDARWREGTPFVVLGDFNRAMDRHGVHDHLWSAIDDGDPSGLKLHRLPAGRAQACWRGTSRHHRHPIDFFVFGQRAWRQVDAASFRELVWARADADPRRGLPSDHCPIAVDLL